MGSPTVAITTMQSLFLEGRRMQRTCWGGVAPGGRVVDQDVDYLLCGPPPIHAGVDCGGAAGRQP